MTCREEGEEDKNTCRLACCRVAQKKIRRHFAKLSRKRWRTFSTRLDPRKLMSFLWRIAPSLNTVPQQHNPFRVLALSKGCDELTIAEEYCTLLTATTAALRPLSHPRQVNTSIDRRMDAMFSLHKLQVALSSLHSAPSPGPDGVRYSALKHLETKCQEHLLKLFNDTWETGVVPTQWKTSCVAPLLKPGKSPFCLSSYRPVALANCVGKLMEKMIVFRMEGFLEKEKVYPDIMSGFCHGRSSLDSVTNLIVYIEQFRSERLFTAAVFLDVKGAFDFITYDTILRALKEVGFLSRLKNWIDSYLVNSAIYI